jgi:large subunit ribosomal protein L4
VTFAAKPRSFAQKVNRKMYRAAMSAILSELNRQGRIMVVESFDIEGPKTKTLIAKLAELSVGRRPLIVTEDASESLYLSARNLPYVEVRDVQGLDPVALVGADSVVFTADAVKKIEEWLA